MSTSLTALVPELQDAAQALLDLAGRARVLPRITSTLRSRSEQERLYRRFLAGASPYPVARPGTSAHEYGLAFDLVVTGEENQNDLGAVWQQWGGVWGGARDPIHFEYPGFRPPAVVEEVQRSPWRHRIAVAIDLILAFQPEIGVTELVASLLRLGFPEWQVLEFLSGPVEYLEKRF